MFTFIIIIITAITSYAAFKNPILFQNGAFSPYDIHKYKQYQRFLSHIFLHVSWEHLIFNMLTLYFFGSLVESSYSFYFGKAGKIIFILEYILCGILASLPGFFKHRNNASYVAVGASGAVSAILFSAIILEPTLPIYIFFIPIGIPAYIFGPAYLAYCIYMSKRNIDNVAHDVHFWGAILGIIMPISLKPIIFENFLMQLF